MVILTSQENHIMAIFSTNHNALPTGYRLEDYQIQQVLGDGSFGITYLAMDTQLSTQVAIIEARINF
jgi:serine/threonine protein kinase